MPGPTVLTLLPELPFPPVTGLQLRLAANLRVIRALAARSVALWFGQDSADAHRLEAHCDEVLHGGAPAPYSSFSIRDRAGQRLAFVAEGLARRPGARYPFSLGYDEIGAAGIIRDAAGRAQADFVVLPTFLGHYARGLVADGHRVIGDAIDVLTDQTLNFLRIYGRRRPWRAPGLAANHVASRSQERLSLPLFEEVWANSAGQAARLREIAPATRVIVVGNVLDEEAIEPTPVPSPAAVGFIGSYAYLPNVDAARYLATEVLPLLRGRVPHARVQLAGGGMAPSLCAELNEVEGVEVLGRVPDSAAFMRGCRALAFPLFFESGPPLKVVEALASGRPVVCSPQVAAALGLADGPDALVGRDAEAFADGLSRVVEDDELAAELASRGRRTFEQRFSLGYTIGEARRQSVLAGEGGVVG